MKVAREERELRARVAGTAAIRDLLKSAEVVRSKLTEAKRQKIEHDGLLAVIYDEIRNDNPDLSAVEVFKATLWSAALGDVLQGYENLETGHKDRADRFLRDKLDLSYRPENAARYADALYHVLTKTMQPDEWKRPTVDVVQTLAKRVRGRVQYVRRREWREGAKLRETRISWDENEPDLVGHVPVGSVDKERQRLLTKQEEDHDRALRARKLLKGARMRVKLTKRQRTLWATYRRLRLPEPSAALEKLGEPMSLWTSLVQKLKRVVPQQGSPEDRMRMFDLWVNDADREQARERKKSVK